ncbi:MAG TPA: signal peptidase II [Bacilli bacterium]
MIYYVIALAVILLDRITKLLVVDKLDLYETIPVIGRFLSISSHRNRGGAFSILQNQRTFFIIVTIVIVAGIVWYLQKLIKRGGNRLLATGLGFVMGGAIGNFIDRVTTGEVVDFVQLHFVFAFFGKHVDYIFPIFNVADVCIDVGIGLILLDTILKSRREKKGLPNEV